MPNTVRYGLVHSGTMARVLPHNPTKPAWLTPSSPDLALQGVLALDPDPRSRDAADWLPRVRGRFRPGAGWA